MREIFQQYLGKDGARVFAKYPAFWNEKNRSTEFYHNLTELFATAVAYEATAMMLYYKAEARSKDPLRIFQFAMREIVEQHGYNPEVSRYIAVWYFLLVTLCDYDVRIGIQQTTDLDGLLDCFINTGEIDYEHEW